MPITFTTNPTPSLSIRGNAQARFSATVALDWDSVLNKPEGVDLLDSITSDRLLGRDTAGSGDVEQISVGGGIEFTDGGAIQTSAFTGDVTKSAGGTALTVANDAVTNAKAANMAQATIKGRASGAGTGDPTDLTGTQATAILDDFTGDSGSGGVKGLVPAPSAADAAKRKVLGAGGIWTVPAMEFDTRAAATAATIDSTVNFIRTRSYSTLYIGGGGLYKRKVSEPSHTAKLQSADGAWWELVPEDGEIHIFQLGGDAARNDSATSITTIFDDAIAAAAALNARKVYIPGGNYYFNTRPAAINHGITVLGEHISHTILNRNYSPGSNTEPFLDWRGGTESGGGLDRVFLKAAQGTNGVALRLFATDATHKPDFFHIGQVVISHIVASTSWYINCLVDGTNAPVSGGNPGVRDLDVEELYCFGATLYGLDCFHCRGLHANFIYSDGDVLITGGTDPNSSADQATTGFYIDRLQADGSDLSVSNSQIVFIGHATAGSTTVAATTLNVSIYGSLGTVTNNGGAPNDVITLGEWTSGVSGDITVDSITVDNGGLHILDTNASHDLIIAAGSDLTADRTLTLVTGDGDRSLTISGAGTSLVAGTMARLSGGQTLTGGFNATPFSAGTKSSGTFTPDPVNGNLQYAVNGGAHTLDPPATDCSIIIQYTNNASAGAITTSGFTKVDGAFTTTNGDDFFAVITRLNSFTHLNIVRLQ
jgi:hypothetical protein